MDLTLDTSPAPATPPKVFCSHTGADKPQVSEFARRLREEQGIDAWFDAWEILPGDDFVARINQGLADCDAGLIFFSHAAAKSAWVTAETSTLIQQMITEGRRLIPVLLESDAPIPPLLKPRLHRSVEEFDRIADALWGRTEKPTLPPPPVATVRKTFVVALDGPKNALTVSATLDGEPLATLAPVHLPQDVGRSYDEWLQGTVRPSRSPATAQRNALERDLHRLGHALGAVIYAGAVGDALTQLLRQAPPGHRIDLVFESDDDTLLALPFEAAQSPDGQVPALHPSVSTARRRRGVSSTLTNTPLASPLKILVAVGAPDEDHTAGAVLDLEGELQGILDAVQRAPVQANAEVRFLEVGHPDEIRNALARDAYHVLHLSGHGSPGAVYLEDEDGHEVKVPARELMDALKGSGRPVPLVFLSFCHGGTCRADTTGFAQALVDEGVPLVLSMQSRVTDGYASELSGAFYSALARGDTGLATQALAEARRGLEAQRLRDSQAGEPTQPEYATATLFCAGGETDLVDDTVAREPLREPPVHSAGLGPVMELSIGELVGRRVELRRTLKVLRTGEDTETRTRGLKGVMLTGMGGVGKSAVAGRVMARLKESGWRVAAMAGAFHLEHLVTAVIHALTPADADNPPDSVQLVTLLQQGADPERFHALQTLLQRDRWVFVLDNFEDNLTVGGDAFLDEVTEHHIETLLNACGQGRLLVTSRYSVPGLDSGLATVALGPLSFAETGKLLHRLPTLRSQPNEALDELLRRMGGHPRVLEYIDGLMNQGRGRLPALTQKLKATATAAGVALRGRATDLNQAEQDALTVAAHDLCLAALLDGVRREGQDEEVLLQASVSGLPITVEGLAQVLHGDAVSPEALTAVAASVHRLTQTSLLTERRHGAVWVHRWTAQALQRETDDASYRRDCHRMGDYQIGLIEREEGGFENAHEAVRNYLDAESFDEAAQWTRVLAEAAVAGNHRAVAASLTREVLRRLPLTHGSFAVIGDIEGEAHMALGYTDRALARYQQLLERQTEKVAAAPERVDWQHNLSVLFNKLGDLLKALGEGDAARHHFEQSLAIAQRLSDAEPGRADWQRDLSVSFNKLGDLLIALGEGDPARHYFEQSLAIAQRLSDAEPGRTDWQRDLSVSFEKLGDLLKALGEGDAARRYFEQCLAIRQRLSDAEPGRADWQRDLAVSFEKLGDLLMALGEGDAARRYFEQSLAIAQRLSDAEPGRADLQRDLSVSFNKLGDLLQAPGEGDAARDYFEQSLAIRQRLSDAEPGRADWQRDLAVSFNKLGDLLRALGEGDAARHYFKQGLAIFQRLSDAEPGRADFLYDLSASLERVGDIYVANQAMDEARNAFRRSLAIQTALVDKDPSNAVFRVGLVVPLTRLAALEPEHTAEYLTQALDLLTALDAENRLMPQYRPWLETLRTAARTNACLTD